MALREVLAELDVKVRGLGSVDAANAELDRYLAAATPVASRLETLRVKQQEAAEMAGRLAKKIRDLQKAEGDHAHELEQLRRAQIRAQESVRAYGTEIDGIRVSQSGATEAGGQWGATLSKGVAVIGAVVAATAGLRRGFDAIVGSLRETIELGSQLDDTAQRLGVASGALQEWQYIAERADVSAESLQRAFGILARNARAGNGPWHRLGISLRGANGELRSQEELFGDAITGLAGVENQTERAALAQELFGRSGAELLTMVRQTPEEIAALRERFAELGGGLEDDVVLQSAAAGDAMQDFRLAMISLKGALAADVLPALTRLIEGAGTVIGKLVELARSSSAVETALGLLAAVAGVLVIALAPVLIPTLLLVAALGALFLVVEDVVTAFRGGDSVFGSWVESVNEMLGVTMTFQGTIETLEITWDRVQGTLLDGVSEVLRAFNALREAIGLGASEGITELAGVAARAAEAARGRALSGEKIRNLAEAERFTERRKAQVRAAAAESTTTVNAPITVNGADDPEKVGRIVRRHLTSAMRAAQDTTPLATEGT